MTSAFSHALQARGVCCGHQLGSFAPKCVTTYPAAWYRVRNSDTRRRSSTTCSSLIASRPSGVPTTTTRCASSTCSFSILFPCLVPVAHGRNTRWPIGDVASRDSCGRLRGGLRGRPCEPLNRGEQVGQIARAFQNVPVHAGRHRLVPLVAVIRTEHDDAGPVQARVRPDRAEDLQALDVGYPAVQDDEPRLVVLQNGQGILAAQGGDALVALRREQAEKSPAGVGVVLYDENHGCVSLRGARGKQQLSSLAGSGLRPAGRAGTR